MLKNYVFTLITLASITTLTSCRQEVRANSEPTTVPIQVRTPAVVERAESVSASGSVEGSETADVAFLVGGKVARVLVEEGQHVTKGQLLAEIEPTDYRNAFNAATAQKEAALAVSQKADAGLRKQELEQARIDFERWEDEYKRMKFLVERKSLPPNDFQKFEAAYNASRERYRNGSGGDAERRPRHRRTHRHARQRPRPARKESGWMTRGSSPRFPGTYRCARSIPARPSRRERRSSPSSTSTRPRFASEFRKRKSRK